ncbi:2-polyprenyl-3-methyl-6-methoxy-1,4-benzoquinone monooxygenase [Methylophilaceae bacterium]|nr:2-polyprenyl-3-methyl-6-methoxy-1,4-benzoquinone monooxygenase [Methylophilaceae bacterium]
MVIDKFIDEIEFGLKILFSPSTSKRPRPDKKILNKQDLNSGTKKKHAQLMRVNHSGEICAQALYRGQLLFNNDRSIEKSLQKAANEEIDHLAWCEERIDELNGKTSLLNPILYIGSIGIGGIASIIDKKYNLGFLAETEKQVSSHLDKHLVKLSKYDVKTKKILEQMKFDEHQHEISAKELGAAELPKPIKKVMGITSKIMTTLTYKI